MEHRKLTTLARRFKRVVSESAVDEMGREVCFCKQERILTPYHLAISLLVRFATMRAETLADIRRCFNALLGSAVAIRC